MASYDVDDDDDDEHISTKLYDNLPNRIGISIGCFPILFWPLLWQFLMIFVAFLVQILSIFIVPPPSTVGRTKTEQEQEYVVCPPFDTIAVHMVVIGEGERERAREKRGGGRGIHGRAGFYAMTSDE